MKKSNAGRPAKDPDKAQTECVSVWFTENEKESIQKASALAEVPVSTWARKVLKDAAKRHLWQ